ncbi:FAD binding domain-containing protein [Neobacillus niacini]|uniref:FAD binding domain-containing protein n=1 Tax=Neobacillus niacini TaxID=86668 RepID=UPI002862CC0E|nr:FAD binding domain-containing protein [Neobacillus niacini]MDR7000646.1 CO/xanthine dehydrogenase FAD-binding subunit [Neobacillus niacini]
MIPFDFEYYKPTTVTEALNIFEDIQKRGKKVIFYSGGTEFITFARMNKMAAEAVIDIKGIPDCQVLEVQGETLVIGSAVSLNKIVDSKLFPLLGQTVKGVADHTSRNKITLGGNINSGLMYREGVLPLLLSDAMVKIAGNEEKNILPLKDVFNKKLQLNSGQLLVQIIIDVSYASQKFICLKKTKISKVGYPVVTIAALIKDSKIRAAFSGVCDYPFRSSEIEAILNDTSLTNDEQIEKAVKGLPSPIVNDIQASAGYREFVLKNTLQETIEALKEKTS